MATKITLSEAASLYVTTVPAKVGDEITLWDKDIDMEGYFFPYDPEVGDDFDEAVMRFLAHIPVVSVKGNGWVCDFSGTLKDHWDDVKDLFRDGTDWDDATESMGEIIGGNVSANWMKKLADAMDKCDPAHTWNP